jgi:outer membrane protein OmpA-like peptidoglycan-associated protein
MKFRAIAAIWLSALLVSGCATKKYVRNRVNERLAPLENRTSELEETSRRNTQEISRLSREIEDVRARIEDVRGRVDRVQRQAERAASSAEQANARVSQVEQSLSDLKTNLDQYALEREVTIFFKAGRSDLTAEARSTLDELASQLKNRNGFLLEIEGHASPDGPRGLNERLSRERSEAVRRYLAEQHGIPLFRMYFVGFGEDRPKVDNATLAGRQQNRRVEIRLLTNRALNAH